MVGTVLIEKDGAIHEYDGKGNELSYCNKDGQWWEVSYDDRGNQLTYRNNSGLEWRATYDKHGNRLTFEYIEE